MFQSSKLGLKQIYLGVDFAIYKRIEYQINLDIYFNET